MSNQDKTKGPDFSQSLVDALTAHIAVLDHTGAIVAVNSAWRRFAQANGWLQDGYGLGLNYLSICEDACGDSSEGALEAAAGIRAVMQGKLDEFQLEYPCHSPTTPRWFNLRVTCFGKNEQLKVVLAPILFK
jgi:hypothetical protein